MNKLKLLDNEVYDVSKYSSKGFYVVETETSNYIIYALDNLLITLITQIDKKVFNEKLELLKKHMKDFLVIPEKEKITEEAKIDANIHLKTIAVIMNSEKAIDKLF